MIDKEKLPQKREFTDAIKLKNQNLNKNLKK